jgi:hypothetical protein
MMAIVPPASTTVIKDRATNVRKRLPEFQDNKSASGAKKRKKRQAKGEIDTHNYNSPLRGDVDESDEVRPSSRRNVNSGLDSKEDLLLHEVVRRGAGKPQEVLDQSLRAAWFPSGFVCYGEVFVGMS